MSGEATSRRTAPPEALERAFGDAAVCNRCASRVAGYRVIANFLHHVVAVRAYCGECYPKAVEGEYHARGDGWVTDYDGFSRRFGAPGPPPPPMTPVDRLLAALIRDPELAALAPPSEAAARRSREVPYRFRVEFLTAGEPKRVALRMSPEGALAGLDGDREACDRLKTHLRSL